MNNRFKALILAMLVVMLTGQSAIYAETEIGEFEPRNVMVSPGKSGTWLVVSFIRPSSNLWEETKVYNITDGQNVEITGDPLTYSNDESDVTRMKVEGLTTGQTYHFKLVSSFSDGTTTEFVTYGVTATSVSVVNPTGWTFIYNTGNAADNWDYFPGQTIIDTETSYEGNASLRIMSSQNLSVQSNLFSALRQSVSTLKQGTSYKLSLWVKALNAGQISGDGGVRVTAGTGWNNLNPKALLNNGTFEWTLHEYTYTHSGSTINISLINERFVEAMWIDNFECREILGDDEFGENILKNSGFEENVTEVQDVTIKTAVPGNRSVELTWDASKSSSIKNTGIYLKEGGKLYKRAVISQNDTHATIGGLQNDHEYEFVLKALDNYGNESPGVTVKATPTAPPYESSEFALSFDSTPVEVLQQGTISVSTTVTNNTAGDGFEATLICVLYDEHDSEKAISISGDTQTIPQSGAPVVLTSDIEIPDSNCRLEVLLWDSADGMTILRPYEIFTK